MTPRLCACCKVSSCPRDGCSRTEIVTCDLCGEDCSCGGCIVDQARRGQAEAEVQETELAARKRLEEMAVMLGGYGSENIDQFLRGDFSCAPPEDVPYLREALDG